MVFYNHLFFAQKKQWNCAKAKLSKTKKVRKFRKQSQTLTLVRCDSPLMVSGNFGS